MYYSKPYVLNDYEEVENKIKNACICSLALLTSPITIPILGCVWLGNKLYIAARAKRVRQKIEGIMSDLKLEHWFASDILVGWTLSGKKYISFDRANVKEYQIVRAIERYWTPCDALTSILILDPFEVTPQDVDHVSTYESKDSSINKDSSIIKDSIIKVYNMCERTCANLNIENMTINLKDGFYGVVGKRFTIEYFDFYTCNSHCAIARTRATRPELFQSEMTESLLCNIKKKV
jgi:hypothetical protein